MASPDITAAWLGTVDYRTAWEWQRELYRARLGEAIGDSLMLLEHPHTYTKGRRTLPDDLVLSERECEERGIAVYDVDRGGRITYHGPGQLVGYPIMALTQPYDVIAYLRAIEEALIGAVAELGVEATRDHAHTGVWVGSNKLAAIGVKITRGITMHGFALNVTTDLSMFGGIVPCGIADRGVTSVAVETGSFPALPRVATLCAVHLAAAFRRTLRWTEPAGLHPVGGVGEPGSKAGAGGIAVETRDR